MTDHLDYAAQDGAGSRSACRWPRVAGWLAIVFAILNMLGGLCLVWANVFVPAAFLAREGYTYDVPWLSWNVGGSLAGVAIQVLLAVSGLLLIHRKPTAIALAKTWAVLALLHALTGAMLESTNESNTAPLLRIFGLIPVGLIVGIALVFGPPILFWIWLSRESVEREVSQWQARTADIRRVENDHRAGREYLPK